MAQPGIERLGVNYFSVHVHGPSPVDGSQDPISADFLEALKQAKSGFFDIDGIYLNFMGGMVPQEENNHDGVQGQTALDALVVRKRS